jgi:2-polyprenyl-3-methyl-5-hydroxy-6-metoxy-1,4-benzoquinol methylase
VGNANLAYEDARKAESAERLLIQEPKRSVYYDSLVARISAYTTPRGSLLEIGCGTGGLLRSLREAGWEVEGIEPSPNLRAEAEKSAGAAIAIHGRRLEDAEPNLRGRLFRAIVAIDVIEHFPDPWILPGKAFEWLEDGGFFFLQTPNAKSLRRRFQGTGWEQLAPKEHFVIHSTRSLGLVLEGCGFSEMAIETVSGRPADTPLRRTAIAWLGRLLRRFNLGNALWAVARKTDS